MKVKINTKIMQNIIVSAIPTFLFAFAVTLIATSNLTPSEPTNADTFFVSVDPSGYTTSVTSADNIAINLETTVNGAITTAHDTVVAKTNNPNGYRLYVSSNQSADYAADKPGNALYKDGNSTSSYFISPTTGTFSAPSTLAANSWGFSLSGDDDDFSAVPLKPSMQLVGESSAATSSEGDNLDVYYGVKADIALPSGTYIGTINYLVLPEGSSRVMDGAAIFPTRTLTSGGTELTIVTSLYTNYEFSTSDAAVTIGGTTCPVTGFSIESGALAIKCTAPAKAAGNYDIVATIASFNKTYTISDFEYYEIPTFFTISTMQEMTPAVCDSATTPAASVVNTGTDLSYAALHTDMTGVHTGDAQFIPERTLIDTRDGNTYRIRKLADGNCWMTENLRLTFDSSTLLSPKTTNAAVNREFTAGEVATTENADTKTKWDPSGSNNATVINAYRSYYGIGSDGSQNSTTLDGESQDIGTYYNWYTATLGTGTWDSVSTDATDSVCPKGWTLPNGGDATSDRSYAKLVDTYLSAWGASAVSSTATSQGLRKFPVSLIFPGNFAATTGTPLSQNTGGHFWTFTPAGDVAANILNIGNTGVNPQNSYEKRNGRSVRCVSASADTFYANEFFLITTMQEMTSAICAAATKPSASIVNTGTDQTYATAHTDTDGSHIGDTSYVPQRILYDIRDGNTYRIRKLADGNCWMTENLRLTFTTRTTLTPYDSDVSSNWMPGVATENASNKTKWDPNDLNNESVVNTHHSYYGVGNKGSQTSDTRDGDSQDIGTYYNWHTATAGSGTWAMTSSSPDATGSVCPKGWTLPNGNGASTNRSYAHLIDTYLSAWGASEVSSSMTSVGLRKFPLSFVFSGNYSSIGGAPVAQDSIGRFWSSTHLHNASVSYLYYNDDDVVPEGSDGKRHGHAVRCLAAE